MHLNLAYRWFCRLGLEDAVPEHSRFSKNRHGRFRESDAFRHVFETVLERCMSEGLLGERLASTPAAYERKTKGPHPTPDPVAISSRAASWTEKAAGLHWVS